MYNSTRYKRVWAGVSLEYFNSMGENSEYRVDAGQFFMSWYYEAALEPRIFALEAHPVVSMAQKWGLWLWDGLYGCRLSQPSPKWTSWHDGEPSELRGELQTQSILTYIDYRAVAGVFQNIDPSIPFPPSECVLPPLQRRGVHTRRAVRGGGASIFWKTPDIGMASIISLRLQSSRDRCHGIFVTFFVAQGWAPEAPGTCLYGWGKSISIATMAPIQTINT
jgi:hypothetical protein